MTTTSKKPAAISALRQRMIDDMTARKLQTCTNADAGRSTEEKSSQKVACE